MEPDKTSQTSAFQITDILNACTAGVLVTDEKGIIRFSNEGLFDLLGYKPDSLVGQPITVLMPSEFRIEHSIFIERFLNNPSRRSMGFGRTFPSLHKNGSRVDIEIGLNLLYHDGGTYIVATISSAALSSKEYIETSKQNSIKQRIERNKRLIQISEASSEAVLIMDANHQVVWANSKYLTLFLANRQLLIGETLENVFEEYAALLRSLFEAYQKNMMYKQDAELYINGKAKYLSLTLSPILSGADVQGAMLSIIDLTEQLQLQNEIIEKKSLLENITHLAKIGYYTLDFATNKLTWSDEIYRIHELPIGMPMDVETAVQFYTEESRPIIEAAIERSLATGEAFDFELPFLTANNREIWVRAVGYVEFNENSMPKVLKGAFQDITHQRESAIKAEEGIRAKSEFLANMSHELRTPINGIKGITELLGESELDEKQQFYVNSLSYSTNSLLNLVNQVLFFAKNEAKPDAIINIKVKLLPFFQQICFAHEVNAERKGLKLSLVVDDACEDEVLIDSQKIEQIANNLISNAVKFTEEGKVTVTISCNETSELTLHVEDTGSGIAVEDQTTLFDAFQQVDMSFARKHQGTGLGLTITKGLVGMLGGSIEVKSEKGKGSVFSCRIPVEIPNKNESSDSYSYMTEQSKCADNTKDLGNVAAERLAGKRILVVEDNEINQIIFSESLSTLGVKVELAYNGIEALDAIEQGAEYDLIIMDCQMPEMDGFQCTKLIREMQENPVSKLPIIAATAHVFDDERDRCMEVGMNDVIQKPFEKQTLIDILLKYI